MSTMSLTWASSVIEEVFKLAAKIPGEFHHLIAFAIWGVIIHYVVTRLYQIIVVVINGEPTTVFIGLKIILGYYDFRSIYLFFNHKTITK